MLPHDENANNMHRHLKVYRREKGHSQLKVKALESMISGGSSWEPVAGRAWAEAERNRRVHSLSLSLSLSVLFLFVLGL